MADTNMPVVTLPGDAQRNLTQSAPEALDSLHLGPCTATSEPSMAVIGAAMDEVR